VPGWGRMPPVEQVLGQMEELGLRGTELGAPGFLRDDPTELSSLLARHHLQLVGGFVALVLHEPRADDALKEVERLASTFARSGGEMLVVAAVQDAGWSPPRALGDEQWRRMAEHIEHIKLVAATHGVTVALHPHAGTLIEQAADIERALDALDVGWCLDTGHLLIGGVDPAAFGREHGDRVVHVHLKDVDATIAQQLRSGGCSLLQATRRGLFAPLGRGDARIAEVLEALDTHGYDGWLVLEQDTAITADEPAVRRGPMLDAQASIEFLHNSARPTQEVK
jgi:inosose dehydratase